MDNYTISPLRQFSAFIKNYPIAQLRQQFSLLESDFPYHRSIKGDGNCFYRAFIFEYLTKTKISSSNFPPVRNICKYRGKIKYTQEQFQQIFNKHLQRLLEIDYDNHREQNIQEQFNKSEELDEIMISYFRSANYDYILRKKSQYFAYMDEKKTMEHQLERISTYSAESEGVELSALPTLFNVRLYIYFIDEKSFQPVVFNEREGSHSFYLFFRPGHYDIVYHSKNSQNWASQMMSKIKSRAVPIQALKNIFDQTKSKLSSSKPLFQNPSIKAPNYNEPSIIPTLTPHPKTTFLSNHTTTQTSFTPKDSIHSSFKYNPGSKKQAKDQSFQLMNKNKNIRTIQSKNSLSQFHSLFMEIVAIGIIISCIYFFVYLAH